MFRRWRDETESFLNFTFRLSFYIVLCNEFVVNELFICELTDKGIEVKP